MRNLETKVETKVKIQMEFRKSNDSNEAAKILVIDDYDGDLEAIKIHLNEEGFYNVFSAGTGEEGCEMARLIKPDLVVVDSNLPTMDGFEVCRKIKIMLDFQAQVILMSGNSDVSYERKAKESGADRYWLKVTDFEPLIDIVKSLFPSG